MPKEPWEMTQAEFEEGAWWKAPENAYGFLEGDYIHADSFVSHRLIAESVADDGSIPMPHRLASWARVIDATGYFTTKDSGTFHEIPMAEWHKILSYQDAKTFDLAGIGYYVHRYSPLNWESLFDYEDRRGIGHTEKMADVLRSLGYDAVKFSTHRSILFDHPGYGTDPERFEPLFKEAFPDEDFRFEVLFVLNPLALKTRDQWLHEEVRYDTPK